MIRYRQIQQHYIQQHKGKSFKCIILHATGTQQPLGAALGRHVTLKYEAAMYLCVYNLCVGHHVRFTGNQPSLCMGVMCIW